MRKYLHYGELGTLAKTFGIKEWRARDVLSGRLSANDAEQSFVMAVYDLTLPRKQAHDKLKVFTQ